MDDMGYSDNKRHSQSIIPKYKSLKITAKGS